MKKLTILLITIIAFGLILIGTTAYADHYKCGNLTVKKGVHAFIVLKHCGEPVSKEDIGHGSAHRSGATREKWVYGPKTGYYYILHIKAGVVDKVETVKSL